MNTDSDYRLITNSYVYFTATDLFQKLLKILTIFPENQTTSRFGFLANKDSGTALILLFKKLANCRSGLFSNKFAGNPVK